MPTSRNSGTKKFDDYHSGVWDHFHKCFDKYIKKRDDESLHQMRVSIKKIIALVHFIEYCNKEFDVKQMEPVTKMFRLSGKLRDNRNAHLFCEKFAIQKSAFENEDSKQKSVLKKLKSRHKKSDSFAKLRNEINKHITPGNARQLKGYLAGIMEQVIIAFGKKISDEKLHDTRKKMKEVTYLSKLQSNRGIDVIGKSRLELLLDLEDVIGDWHDLNKFRVQLQNKKINKKVFDKVKEKEYLLHSETLNLASIFTGKTR